MQLFDLKKAALLLLAGFLYTSTTAQFSPAISTPANAVVQTQYGPVRGYVESSIYTFKGIPYATAKRFELPAPPQPWSTIKTALAYGPVSPQAAPNVIDQSEFFFHHDFGYPGEDCMRLNIWTPNINQPKGLPVMVWLHGGGFATGSGNELPSYDGRNLSETGQAVVVSLNHRLNILGYLNLSAYGDQFKHTPNLGMLDIVEALKWIKSNIAAFGGNPDNITVFGQSGGGRKVCALLGMPAAAGLFHKAIIQSGASLEYYTQEQSQEIASRIVKELGLNAASIDKIKDIPYHVLLSTSNKVLRTVNEEYLAKGQSIDGFQVRWGPTVDGSVIPLQPTDAGAFDVSKNIPVIIGSNKHEFVQAFNSSEFINPASVEEAKQILYPQFGQETDRYIKYIRQAYPNAKRPLDLLDVDVRGRVSTIQWASIRANYSKVYMYLFAWESPVLEGRFRSAHCLELPFVFNNISRCVEMTGGGKDAISLAKKMSGSWINFARTGSPNTTSLPAWGPYTKQSGATMLFNSTNQLVHHHDQQLMDFATGIKNNK